MNIENINNFEQALKNYQGLTSKILDCDLTQPSFLDFTVHNSALNATEIDITKSMELYVENILASSVHGVAIGRYAEDRVIYKRGKLFADTEEARSLHLGIDIFTKSGKAVFAPILGVVHSFNDNNNIGDYGPTIILEHKISGVIFYTLYGHLSRESLDGLIIGKKIENGERIGEIGAPEVNGNWPAHLHFEIITDMLSKYGDFPGVAKISEKNYWLSICPDPNLLLRIY